MTVSLPFAEPSVVVLPQGDGSTIVRSAVALTTPPPTIFSWLRRWARERPNTAFVTEPLPVGERVVLTYGRAAEQTERLAGFLASTGVAPGDRVVIAAPNSIQHLLWALAVMRAGAIYVPMAPQYVGPSHDRGKLERLLIRLAPRLVLCGDEEQAMRVPPKWPKATLLAVARAAELGDDQPAPAMPDARADAKILFTSGSTADPKAVPYTHGLMTAATTMTTQVWSFVRERPPVVLDWLPWNHAFGGTANLHLVLSCGGTLHIDDGDATAAGVARTLEQLPVLRPNMFFAVPATLDLLLGLLTRDRDVAAAFFATVRAVFSAGASLSPVTFAGLRSLSREVGSEVALLSGWGGTETGPGATLVHRADVQPGWIGGPLPGVELKLTPESGKLHVSVRGPNVFRGYWGDPDSTAAAFDTDGFYSTGDAARLVDPRDPGLGLVFDGRLGEDFKLANGTWVNYAKVREELLVTLAGRAADLVIGMPDASSLVALVWPRDGSELDDDQLEAALLRYNRRTSRPSHRLRALRLLRTPPNGDELTPKGQLRARHIREVRRAEFVGLLTDACAEVVGR